MRGFSRSIPNLLKQLSLHNPHKN